MAVSPVLALDVAADAVLSSQLCLATVNRQANASAFGQGRRPFLAHRNTVISSTNSSDGSHCVDIFRRPDGSYGFDLFRRDPEDPRGWYSVGHFGGTMFDSDEDARAAAWEAVEWFDS